MKLSCQVICDNKKFKAINKVLMYSNAKYLNQRVTQLSIWTCSRNYFHFG